MYTIDLNNVWCRFDLTTPNLHSRLSFIIYILRRSVELPDKEQRAATNMQTAMAAIPNEHLSYIYKVCVRVDINYMHLKTCPACLGRDNSFAAMWLGGSRKVKENALLRVLSHAVFDMRNWC